MANKVFGIEVRNDDIRIAIIDSRFRVQKAIHLLRKSQWLKSDKSTQEYLRSAMDLLGFNPEVDYVVTVLPGRLLTCRKLTFPMKKRRQIEEVLPYELESYMPFEVEDICVGFDIIEEDENGATVLVAVACKNDMKKHLEFFDQAEVVPDAVVAGPLSLFNNELSGTQMLPRILVSIESDYISVALSENQQPLMFHSFPATNDPTKVAREVKRLTYSVGQEKGTNLGEVIVQGAGCVNSDFINRLGNNLNVPVKFPVLDNFEATVDSDNSNDISNLAAVFSVPLGAAYALANAKVDKLLNFRTGEFKRKARLIGQRAQMLTTAALIMLGIFVWALSFGGEVIALSSTYNDLKNRTRAEFRRAIPNETNIVYETQQLKNSYKRLLNKSHSLGIIGSITDPALDRLLDITRSVPRTGKLDVENFVYEDTEIVIAGRTESFEQVEQLKKEISRLLWVNTTTVDHAKAGVNSAYVNFRLKVTVSQ